MKKLFESIISTKTFRHSFVTSLGTIINASLGFVFYILVARFLGPSDFGIFSVATATVALLASIFNIGVDTGLVRFVGKYYSSDLSKTRKYLKLGFEVKLISGVILVTLGWFLIPWVSEVVLGKPELIFALRLSLIGAFGSLLSFFVTSAFQAMQKFVTWSAINIFMNALRLVAFFVIVFFSLFNIRSGLFIYMAAPFAGFLLGMLYMPKFLQETDEKTIINDFFKYNRWIAIFTVIVAISSRLDTYLSTRLLSLSDLGIYSVAVSLASIVPEIVLALGTVVAPKFASLRNNVDAKIFFKKLQLFVCGLAMVGIVVGVPLSYIIIPAFYGNVYLPSILPFVILLAAQAIFLISIPAHTSIFYYFAYPKVFVYFSLTHLFIVGVLGWLLIGWYGYVGAAVTMLIGNLFNFILPLSWVLNKFKKA